ELVTGGVDAGSDGDADGGLQITLPAELAVASEGLFLGRGAELARLQDAWERTVAGERRLVLVAGEAGIGKSRLATEFAVKVHETGGTVLLGRCAEETLAPYQPFVEALRHYVLGCERRELLA